MKVYIELSETDVRRLVIEHIRSLVPSDFDFRDDYVCIQVKSRQNFKSEWEIADFRAVFNRDI